jgi:hypothetical protein
MWPVTQRYLDTLTRSHTQVSYMEIIKDGVVAATLSSGSLLDPTTGLSLSSIGGSVQVSKTTIRRSCTVVLLDVSGQLMPSDAGDLLAPYVTEIRLWVGVRYWDAPLPAVSSSPFTATPSSLDPETEYVPVGTFVITDLDNQYPQITITGYDRMWILGQFTAPYAIANGTNVIDALSTLLSAQVPASRLATNFPTSEKVTGALLYDAQTDTTAAAFDLVTPSGWDLYVDPVGTFMITPQPSTDDDPILTYTTSTGNMMRPKHAITSGGTLYNAVVFTGESAATTPVRGYAQDDDPNSLTFVGRVGVRPYFESSPLMKTVDACNAAARTRLRAILGTADTLIVPIIPNHALECGDVIHVIDPTQGIDTNVITDSFTIGMRASDGVQDVTCRSKVIR